MASLSVDQWELIDEVLRACGAVDLPYDFGVTVAKEAYKIHPFDRATVYFLDEMGTIYDHYLIGISQESFKDFRARYSASDDGAYDAERMARERALRVAMGESDPYDIIVIDWETEPHTTEFYQEYLVCQNLRWCTAFALYDLKGRVRVVEAFDRRSTSPRPSEGELDMLRVVNRHLDAMYRHFFVEPPIGLSTSVLLAKSGLPLTKRELDVAYLLLEGLSAKSVAHALGISKATVYRHIANMHTKLGVSNQATLLRLLRDAVSAQQRL